jgi:hypothetical protein
MSQRKELRLSRTRLLLAVVLVAALLYVAIAPSLDLAPSALRASRAAMLVLICLRLWLYLSVDTSSLPLLLPGIEGWRQRKRAPDSQGCDLLDLLCARLC